MWLPRLHIFNEYKNKYYIYGGKFYNCSYDNKMGNCAEYELLRMFESQEVENPYPMFEGRGACGYPNALNWKKETLLPTGDELREGACVVCDGNFGHVFNVEVKTGSNRAIISQSQYQENKNLRNDKYWETREIEIVVGKSPMAGIGPVLGFIYPPINDIRVARNTQKRQVEIIEDYVNVRTSPNGDIFCQGLYAPKGIFNITNIEWDGKYNWYELEANHWIRQGSWTKFYEAENSEIETLKAENEKLKAENKEYLDKLNAINDILN